MFIWECVDQPREPKPKRIWTNRKEQFSFAVFFKEQFLTRFCCGDLETSFEMTADDVFVQNLKTFLKILKILTELIPLNVLWEQ